MITIRELAKIANVSIATVSRVLNNDTTYKITRDTRERVLKAVAQTGYKLPAHRAESIKRRHISSIKIGCILSVTREKYKDPYFMDVLAGVEECCSKKGYSLAFARTYYELKDKNVLYETFKEPLDGLIIMESLERELYGYIRKRVPVCVGIDTAHRDIDNIAYNHLRTASDAVQHLIDSGHKKIAFIGGSGTTGNILNSQRYWGYYITMTKAGFDINNDYICDCQWDENLCVKAVNKLISLPSPPDAIFVASDLMAIAALSALYSLGINVPKQIAVVGLTGLEISKFSSPPLTTLVVPTKEMGIAAINLIEERLRNPNSPLKEINFETSLVKRISG